MGFFNFFKKSKPPQMDEDRVIFFHEDEYRQIEIVPAENLFELEKELDNVIGFSKESFDGYGFKKMHARKGKRVKLIDKEIEWAVLEGALGKTHFERFDFVRSGYSSASWDCEFTVAYGKPGCVFFYEFAKDYVDTIWLDYIPALANEEDKMAMLKLLGEIGKQWSLILVDWNLKSMVDLKDEFSLENYLRGEEPDAMPASNTH